ncbi:hypothetical protein ACFVW9_14960 [Streptomyces sp. NPDC058217]|uniref:hypothetical protein n=1 Tax=Streptomyces sp. NPDC058217 TaxID=3346384 RepID=UPI0036E16488
MVDVVAGESAQGRRRRRTRTATGAAVLVIVAAAGGFYAGHSTSPSDSTADECSTARASEQRAVAAMNAASPNSPEHTLNWRTGLNIVLQNPGCYSAEDRASAQAILDQAASAQQATEARSQCEATAEHWWDCN